MSLCWCVQWPSERRINNCSKVSLGLMKGHAHNIIEKKWSSVALSHSLDREQSLFALNWIKVKNSSFPIISNDVTMAALTRGWSAFVCVMVAGSLLPAYLSLYIDSFSLQCYPLLSVESVDSSLPASRTPLVQSTVLSAEDRHCALLFFGLPRAFKALTLPSLKTNILQQNRGCDIYVHYFRKTYESPGRANRGGKLNSDDILLLLRDVWEVYRLNPSKREPVVIFDHDTDATFHEARKDILQRIRTSKNPDGNYSYFPTVERRWLLTW